MKYYSTRDTAVSLSAAQAVKQGLSRDGGLLTPETFPALTQGRTNRQQQHQCRRGQNAQLAGSHSLLPFG